MRRSIESTEMRGVKDIAFVNSALVFLLMHLFLTDLDSVVTEINILTMDEMFRPLLMSKSRVCLRLCVGPSHAESGQKCLKQLSFLL